MPDIDAETLLQRRGRTLGPYSPLFYEDPIEIVAGEGVWLTASDGHRYLDGYNNVPHVGHANPTVIEAITRQWSEVNLHTRYLNDKVVNYAERLLSTFPDRLNRVFFTNSGSEANELALRIARQHTESDGVIVSDWSYHGNTTSIAELSTGLRVAEPLGKHVRAVRIPDLLHDLTSDEDELLQRALAEVDRAIESLQETGHRISALLIDPLFSTEGLVEPPRGYVEGLVERVHAAGGLFIADEVQSGFGRTGTHMWGFQNFDAPPDLVVLGKPMGNGHPLGAVITTQALLEEFGGRNDYFNTFSGTPVSSEAGNAVLEVMERDDLMGKAAEVGTYVADRLARIASTSNRVAAVRGTGMYFGLEIVDPESREPDAVTTKALIEEMKRRKVLISRIGRDDNVLKMRPPLVFTKDHAEILLDQLESVVEGFDK